MNWYKRAKSSKKDTSTSQEEQKKKLQKQLKEMSSSGIIMLQRLTEIELEDREETED